MMKRHLDSKTDESMQGSLCGLSQSVFAAAHPGGGRVGFIFFPGSVTVGFLGFYLSPLRERGQSPSRIIVDIVHPTVPDQPNVHAQRVHTRLNQVAPRRRTIYHPRALNQRASL
jgi:hypothetical protein